LTGRPPNPNKILRRCPFDSLTQGVVCGMHKEDPAQISSVMEWV